MCRYNHRTSDCSTRKWISPGRSWALFALAARKDRIATCEKHAERRRPASSVTPRDTLPVTGSAVGCLTNKGGHVLHGVKIINQTRWRHLNLVRLGDSANSGSVPASSPSPSPPPPPRPSFITSLWHSITPLHLLLSTSLHNRTPADYSRSPSGRPLPGRTERRGPREFQWDGPYPTPSEITRVS